MDRNRTKLNWVVAGLLLGLFVGQPVWSAYLGLVGLA